MSPIPPPLPATVHEDGALASAQEAVAWWRQQPPSELPDPRFLAALEMLGRCLGQEGQEGEARVALAMAAAGWEERFELTCTLSDQLALHACLDIQCEQDWERGDWSAAAAQVELQMECLDEYGACDDPDWLAAKVGSLNRRIVLSAHLHDPEEGLTAARDILDPLRALTAQDPAFWQPHLVDRLRALSKQVSTDGDAVEAYLFALEAVTELRKAALREPTLYDEALAEALLELSDRYMEADRDEPALAAAEAGVALLREIVQGDPASQPQLAGALTQLGCRYHQLDRLDAAILATTESVQLHRSLYPIHPPSYGLPLANALNNLGAFLAERGSAEAACTALEEAIALYQGRVGRRRWGVELELARSWRNLSDALSTLGRHPEALAATEAALALLRAAPATAEAREHLVICLSELNIRLSALYRHEEALAAISEALALWKLEQRRGEHPDPQQVACLLNQQSVDLLALGRMAAAHEAAEGAVDLYRRLGASPDRADPEGLARSLNNLGLALHGLGRLEAAAEALEESLSFYFPSREHPPLEHAFVQHNLSRSLAALGRHAEAQARAVGAVELHRLHLSLTPRADPSGLAQALLGLSLRFAQDGALRASLDAAEEAVEHYRADPNPLRRGLIRGLMALGRARAATDPQGALATIEEAVGLAGALGPAQPVGDQALRVEAMDALQALLTALGRSQEAMAAGEAAATLARGLAAADPVGWAAAQMDRVGWPPAKPGGPAG